MFLHYYPRHVSNINMSIFRRKNCIHTASDIFALCKRLHSTLVESGLSPPMKMGQSVPKCWHIKFRHRGITQKKAYNINNMAKV